MRGNSMEQIEKYKEMKIVHSAKGELKEMYSVTGDILSYRRCPRSYSIIAERGFIPAQPSQRYVGSVIHQVLDRTHRLYSGRLDSNKKGQIPSDEDIKGFFDKVDEAMRAHGIRPFNKDLATFVLKIRQRFNKIEGPLLYPRVKDTEHRLQSDRDGYILHGVVDVLVAPTNSEKDDNFVEIWDYKGSRRPKGSNAYEKKILEDYEYQMLVYSSLFKLRNGYYPTKGVIYFLGELNVENLNTSPSTARLEVSLDEARMKEAMKSFDDTVEDIKNARRTQAWDPPANGSKTAGKETCDACDIRASCPSEKQNYHHRYPGT